MIVCRRLTASQIEFFKMVDEKVASVSIVRLLNNSCTFLSYVIFIA